MNIKNILKILVTISLILFFIFNIDMFKLASSLNNVSLILVLLCFILFLFSLFLMSLRLFIISKIFKNLTILKSLEATIYSHAMGYFFLPGITSEISRFYTLNQSGKIDKSNSFVMLVYDRYCGLVASLTVTFLGFILTLQIAYNLNSFIVITLIISAVISIILFSFYAIYLKNAVLLIPNFNKLSIINNLFLLTEHITNNKKNFLVNIIVSITIQFCSICIVYVLAYDIGNPIDIRIIIFLMPSISIIASLPITFGGIGLREFMFVAGFVLYDVSKTVSFIIGFNYTLLLFSVIVFSYLIFTVFNYFLNRS